MNRHDALVMFRGYAMFLLTLWCYWLYGSVATWYRVRRNRCVRLPLTEHVAKRRMLRHVRILCLRTMATSAWVCTGLIILVHLEIAPIHEPAVALAIVCIGGFILGKKYTRRVTTT